MARNATVNGAPHQWTQLTNANAASVAVQNQSGGQIIIQATTGNTEPAGDVAGYVMATGAAEVFTLADSFPGVAGAARLWAYPKNDWCGIQAFVSHADA